jgi:hypothetical protein
MPRNEPTAPPTERSTTKPPIRGSDRNQGLVERVDPASEATLFPSLDDGIVLLDISDPRGVPILQSMVVDHLLMHHGSAFWVDANGHATTTTLARIAPSRRLLNRIHVARGFTAYQHYAAVADLSLASAQCGQADTDQDVNLTESQPPHAPSLIVVPAIDARYREEDSLPTEDATTLQARTLAQLSTYASDYEVPVLVTRTKTDEFTSTIATAADQHIECEQTELGPRFRSDDFETQVYPVAGGRQYQTTLAYWQQLLATRASQLGIQPSEPELTPSGKTERSGRTTSSEASVQSLDPAATTWPTTGEW